MHTNLLPTEFSDYVSLCSYLFILFTDATIYVGGLDEKVSDTLMWELFVQAGPVGELTLQWLDNYSN